VSLNRNDDTGVVVLGLYEKLQNMFNNKVAIEIIFYLFSDEYESADRYSCNRIWKQDNHVEAWFDNYHLFVYDDDTIDFYYDD
jgi:hypothetical protein